EAFGGSTHVIENMTRQNMAMFERAMQMFSPFAAARTQKSGEDDATVNGAPDAGRTKPSEEISELKSEIEAMRRQLAELSQRK
ncbi:MAG: hypothetical protein ACXWLD_10385, partial [Rhizomicrobium sp.]